MSEVLVITNNLNQASFRLRIAAIREPLAARGINLHIEVRPRSFLARRRLLRTASQYDAVLLQRKFLSPSETTLLHRQAKRLFYDVDDAVMYSPKPIGLLRRWELSRQFRSTAQRVTQAVVGNDYLADLFRREGASTAVLPTCVDLGHYKQKSHAPTSQPTLVWIGSKSTLGYMRELASVLSAAAKQVPGLRLMTIADATLDPSPLPIEHIPWSEQTEADALARADIGIAPMPSNPWTLGKCGFKILQYMAAGLPVIASPVGANAQIVVANQTGLQANTEAEWLSGIAKLASDVALRGQYGQVGRKRVEEQYSLQRAVDFWIALLKE